MNTDIFVPAGFEPFIAKLEDLSHSLAQRVRVTFTNGYALSIIQGPYSYGGPEGLYEIAPINKSLELDGSLFDEEDLGDDVLGYCTLERVRYYMNKLAQLP